MLSRMPRWLMLTLLILAVVIVIGGLVLMSISRTPWLHIVGLSLSGLLVALIIILVATQGPQLLKMYRFQRHFKGGGGEAMIRSLPTLLEAGRTQEAMMRFDQAMKDAPDMAYMFYMRAMLARGAGKLPEAMAAANKALSLIPNDPTLASSLQQAGGQMGQPRTVDEFRTQLEELRRSLAPRVSAMRERHDKAVSKRKKKSR